MKIAIGKTAAGKNINFELDTLLVTRLLIQANSGAGKSWLLRKLMEELFGHVQVIAIDPEGEFATLREKFDYVLVGKGGETPAHVSTAAEVATKLLELRASAVCDLYEMPAVDRHEWVKTFLAALIDAPKKLWHPAVIIVDEAQMFCPEKGAGESVASGPMVDLTTRGRKRGFCPVWATQRLAKVSKDATSMLLNRLVGGTFEDVDIKRALDLLSVAPEDKREVIQQLKTLDPGNFFAFGRAISKERVLFQVGEVKTSHPKPGSAKHAAEPPAPSEKVRAMLGALADIPKVAEEKAKSLADMQKQLREAKTEIVQLRRSQTSMPVAADPKELRNIRQQLSESAKRVKVFRTALEELMKIIARVNVTGFTDAAVKPEELKSAMDAAASQIAKFAKKKLEERSSGIEALKKDVAQIQRRLTQILEKKEESIDVSLSVRQNEPFTVKPVTPRAVAPRVEGNGDLSRSQAGILAALAKAEALGRKQVRRSFLAALAGVSTTSGGFRNNLSSLRVASLIDYPGSDFVALTESGRNRAPEVDPPTSPDEMLEMCKALLSGSQGSILDALAKAYPEELDRDELATAAGVSSTSGGFRNNLSSLRTAGMIDYPAQNHVKLASWVMLEDAA